MPLAKLQFQPGFDKQNTEYGAEGKWIDGDNVRFRFGLPEKIGGWAKVSSTTVLGAARAVNTWADLDGVKYTMTGTNKKLYVYSEGTWQDITPIRATAQSITQFETVNASKIVIVTDASHGVFIGDFVTISSVSGDIGGITQANLQNEFEILTVPTTSTYTIESPAAATSSTTGATATSEYQINTSPATSIFGYGWGASSWGASTWDTTREGLTGASGVLLDSGKWAIDNWGEDILACRFDGGLYYWDTSGGMSSNPASTTSVSNAPTKSRFVLVSGEDRHVICFGTETTIADTSTRDNMFIRWSDQEDVNTWTPTATNTAGTSRLTDGNIIVTAVRSRGVTLIWTDTSLHQMQFIGPPFTFGFRQLGSNCGAAGLNSAIDINGMAFWMGNDAFFVFDGQVRKLPCTVQDYVFNDIQASAQRDVFASANTEFNEVTWFYASSDSTQIDRHVTFNYLEQLWYVGSLARSSWADRGVYSNPYATDYSTTGTDDTVTTIYGLTAGRSTLYSHENGVNDDGSAMTAYIESGDIDIADGDQFMSIRRFIPDFKDQAGTVNVTVKTRPYPSATQTSHGAYAITTSTTKQDTRIRGRQIAIRLESSAADDKWRYGTMRIDAQPDGLRGA